MLISDNVLNVLAACEYRGIGRAWVNHHLRGGESPAAIVSVVSDRDASATLADFEDKRQRIRGEIERLKGAIDGVTGLGDPDFPVIRPDVREGDRPVALFYRGDIGLIKSQRDNVAVIGLLEPTEQIERDELNIVRHLVHAGKCIVSGLARGCDSIGHRGALVFGGKTVAFLSSPLNEVNPPSNRPLADEIVAKGGLLATEYFRGAKTKREFVGRYAERDRLQALFAESIVLAASYSKTDYGQDSGSRFAMGKAIEYGVLRYVIYDRKRDGANPMFNLSREALAKGARLIDPGNNEMWSVCPHPTTTKQLELGF